MMQRSEYIWIDELLLENDYGKEKFDELENFTDK